MNLAPRRFRFGDLEVDTAVARLLRGGEPVRLEPRTFRLLLFLLENPRRLVTKSELLEHVWDGAFVTDNALDRAVARLRKALDDDVRAPRFLETVPTLGYRFVAEVTSEPIAAGVVADPRSGPGSDHSSATRAPSLPSAAAGARRPVALVLAAIAGAIAALLGAVALVSVRARDAPVVAVGAASGSDHLVARQLTSAAAFELSPSFSPDGSALAYTSNQSGDLDVWVRSLEPGGRDRQLTDGAGVRVAAWSPDGRWIAYDTYDGIWIVPPNGGSPRQLTVFGGSPRWSPDASTLVFQSSVVGVDINSFAATRPSTLHTVGIDGGAPRLLTRVEEPAGGHGQPTFSPDGRRVAFVTTAFGRPGEMWTMSATGGDLRRVLSPCQCRDVVYAPDGETLYYNDFVDSQHGLWAIDVDGEGPARRLYEAPLRFLSVSPDGRQLAASRHDLKGDLWSIEMSPESGAPIGSPAAIAPRTDYRTTTPVASPDGRRIAFVVARTGNLRELWTMDVDGGRTEAHASGAIGGWPAWSADSGQIFFVDGKALQRIALGTRRLATVLTTELDWQTPAVAPGGAAVAFSLVDTGEVTNVWTLDVEGRLTQVTRGSGKTSYPTWSRDGRTLSVEVGRQCAWVAASGGEPVTLTSAERECFNGGWSPDGDKFLVVMRPGEGPRERWDVWWVSRGTGELRQLTERPPHPGREFVRYPTWSAAGDRVYFELAQSSADLWLFDLRQ